MRVVMIKDSMKRLHNVFLFFDIILMAFNDIMIIHTTYTE